MDTDAVFLHHNPSGPSNLALPAPNPVRQHDLTAFLERLQFFLATAPNRWPSPDKISPAHHHPALNRFLLPTGEYVTCILWNGVYYITGTDIVRALVFRFEAFGRPVRNMKKFEEGVFSDLRNLKPGHDACLEEPKSQFLDLLFKYQCIRTQKKQKVFYWFSVPHDRLFIDALDRDLKREKYGHESTTQSVAEPALSFSFDPKRPLFEQFNIKSMTVASSKPAPPTISLPELNYYNARPNNAHSSLDSRSPISPSSEHGHPSNAPGRSIFFNLLPFLEGAPNYKQRRKKAKARPAIGGLNSEQDGEKLYGRRSLDANLAGAPVVGRRSFEVGATAARRSYDAPAPRHSIEEARSFSMNHHLGLAPLGLRTTPAAAHVCQLFTCGQAFATAEQLNGHMRTHETNAGSAERGSADVDPQQRRETPDIPQFNLTTPDDAGDYDGNGYEYEDDKGVVAYQNAAVVTSSENTVAAPLKWGEDITPTLDTTQASHISPFAFNCNATPTTSVSGSSPALSLTQLQTHLPLSEHHRLPSHSNGSTHPHPLSAPSHKLTFDVPPLPPSSNGDPRPRSADERQPGVHARRPSTASAVPSATASSNSLSFATSPSFSTSSHAWRYQPYPSRRVTTPSGYSTPARSIGTRDHSPSGMALDFSSSRVSSGHGQGEYIPPPTASSIEYNGSDYTCSQNSIASEGSPSAPFAHMLTLQETSPSLSHNSMELQYPPPLSSPSGAAQGYGSVQCAENEGLEYDMSQSYDNSQQGGHPEAYNPDPNVNHTHDEQHHHHHRVAAENASHSVQAVESPTPYVAAPQPSYPMPSYGPYSSETSSAGMGMTECQPSYLFASHYYEQPVA